MDSQQADAAGKPNNAIPVAASTIEAGAFFCGHLIEFSNATLAASIAFAFAVIHTLHVNYVEGTITFSDVFWNRALPIFASLYFVVDDWYGSRKMIAIMKDRLLAPNLAFWRFSVDLVIAITAFPLIMSAGYGSRAVGLFIAGVYFLGALWLYLCYYDVKMQNVTDRLVRTITVQILAGCAIIGYYLMKYGFNFNKWFGPYENGAVAGILVAGSAVICRVLLPWAYDKNMVAILRWRHNDRLGDGAK